MSDEPLTPVGRLLAQPLLDNIPTVVFAVESPIDVDAFKAGVSRSFMLQNPRFCSLIVRDSGGREQWRRTAVDVDRHIVIHRQFLSDDPAVADEDAVNDFVADLSVSSPLPADKPPWEFHLLLAHNTIVFRQHHALGDGISAMSMLLLCCRRADDPSRRPTIVSAAAAELPRRKRWSALWTLVLVVWCNLISLFEFLLRVSWLKDRATTLSGGGDGMELWPRKLATARFRLDDMKIVKRAVAGATINDVLLGVISYGFSRYLDITSPKALPEGLRITGCAMTNLRPQKGLLDITQMTNKNSEGRWGNIFGVHLLPVYYHRDRSDPIQSVKSAKAMMDKKKRAQEAQFCYRMGVLLSSLFGAKFVSMMVYRFLSHTTFMVTNVMGPTEKIAVARNPVKSLRVSSTCLPHAITMHMVTYAGTANLQILVAKDVIPDPKVLAQCLKDALLDMKQAALPEHQSL